MTNMKRDCQHKQANHQHGTSTMYVLDKCRCAECREANRATAARRRKQQAFGRYESPYVDAQPVRDHVHKLNSAGIGGKTIAQKAGVSYSTLTNLIYGRPRRNTGPSKYVRRETATKILTVTTDQLADVANIDSTGTVRRLQALVAVGWSMSKLGQKLGIIPTNMTALMNGNACYVRTARAVRDLYDQLWDTMPARSERHDKIAYSRARNYAQQHGWLPPLAWDDEQIDNPDYQPDQAAITAKNPGGKRIHVEDIEWILGYDPAADWTVVADRLKVKRNSVEQALGRAGRQDLIDRLYFNRQEYAA